MLFLKFSLWPTKMNKLVTTPLFGGLKTKYLA